RGKISPDLLFSLKDPTLPEGKNTWFFFVEFERAKLSKYESGIPSILPKLRDFYELYNTDEAEQLWGFRKFRVIVIQRTDRRRETLLEHLSTTKLHRSDRGIHDREITPEKRECTCTPHTLENRMFWLTTQELFKRDIGGEIFKTPKDYEKVAYSFLSL